CGVTRDPANRPLPNPDRNHHRTVTLWRDPLSTLSRVGGLQWERRTKHEDADVDRRDDARHGGSLGCRDRDGPDDRPGECGRNDQHGDGLDAWRPWAPRCRFARWRPPSPVVATLRWKAARVRLHLPVLSDHRVSEADVLVLLPRLLGVLSIRRDVPRVVGSGASFVSE